MLEASKKIMTIFVGNQEKIQNPIRNVKCISIFCVFDGVMMGEDVEDKTLRI
jgi:hypothetical protein